MSSVLQASCWEVPARPSAGLLEALQAGPFKGLAGE